MTYQPLQRTDPGSAAVRAGDFSGWPRRSNGVLMSSHELFTGPMGDSIDVSLGPRLVCSTVACGPAWCRHEVGAVFNLATVFVLVTIPMIFGSICYELSRRSQRVGDIGFSVAMLAQGLVLAVCGAGIGRT